MLIGVPEAAVVTSNPGGLLYKDWEIAQANGLLSIDDHKNPRYT